MNTDQLLIAVPKTEFCHSSGDINPQSADEQLSNVLLMIRIYNCYRFHNNLIG